MYGRINLAIRNFSMKRTDLVSVTETSNILLLLFSFLKTEGFETRLVFGQNQRYIRNLTNTNKFFPNKCSAFSVSIFLDRACSYANKSCNIFERDGRFIKLQSYSLR